MASLNFGAQVEDWVRQASGRLAAVFRESAQRTASLAQANLTPHVDTGFLRASIRASTSEMPKLMPPPESGSAPARLPGGGDVTMTISTAQIGQTIYVGYTAFYAPFLEYGTAPHLIFPKEKFALHWMEGGKGRFAKYVKHPGTRPVAFVGRATAQWQQTVAQVTNDLKNRIASR